MANSFVISNVHIENLHLTVGGADGFRQPGLEVEFVPVTPDPTASFHLVRPVTATTGTICATIRIDPPMGSVVEEVKAYVYDFMIYTDPAPTSQPPVVAVPGHGEAGNRWSWGGSSGAPEIPGAVHNAGGSALNVLAVWKRFRGTTSFVFDGRLFFTGKTGGSGPCGGSGSSSSGLPGVARPADALGDCETLLITIVEGKLHGFHKAGRRGHLLWEATIGGGKYAVSVGACGKRLVLHTPKGSITSAELAGRPLKATFEGDAFSGSRTVQVTEG